MYPKLSPSPAQKDKHSQTRDYTDQSEKRTPRKSNKNKKALNQFCEFKWATENSVNHISVEAVCLLCPECYPLGWNYSCGPVEDVTLWLLDMCRGRFCVGRGTLCSGTTGSNGMWRTQLDVKSPPRLSASWSPPLTLRGWPSLTSECEQIYNIYLYVYNNTWLPSFTYWMNSNILFQSVCNSVLCHCVFSLASQQKAVKQKMASSKSTLLKRFDELKKDSGTGTELIHLCFPTSFKETRFRCCYQITWLLFRKGHRKH